MNQIQKLYTKWILLLATPILDPLLTEHQSGFRRTRQASEPLFTLHRLTELVQEWEQPLTLLRLDLSKAFDKMTQSSILKMLLDTPPPPLLTLNIARELVGTTITPHLYGITTPEPANLAERDKHRAPESGMLFISTLNWALRRLLTKWIANSYGVPIGTEQLTHQIFVDDLLMISAHPHSLRHMLADLRPALEKHRPATQ